MTLLQRCACALGLLPLALAGLPAAAGVTHNESFRDASEVVQTVRVWLQTGSAEGAETSDNLYFTLDGVGTPWRWTISGSPARGASGWYGLPVRASMFSYVCWLRGLSLSKSRDRDAAGPYQLQALKVEVNGKLLYEESAAQAWLSTDIPWRPADFTPIPSNGPPCDVNGDGEVNLWDVLAAMRIAAGLVEPAPGDLAAADLRGDGVVTADEVLAILRVIAGLDPYPLPSEELTAAPQPR
ncbi:MAG TPA: dockerin type I repeat-containing protein [Armatimonadota bacterium]|jgi:hypothetical protein